MKEKEIIEIIKELKTIYENPELNEDMIDSGLCWAIWQIRDINFNTDIVLNFIKNIVNLNQMSQITFGSKKVKLNQD